MCVLVFKSYFAHFIIYSNVTMWLSVCTILGSIIIGGAVYYYFTLLDYRRRAREKIESQNLKYVHVNAIWNIFIGVRQELQTLQLIRREGRVYATDVFGSTTIICAEPELVQAVLSKDFTNFSNRREIKLNDPIFDSFLSVVADDQWKRIRSIVAPTFAAGKLRRMKPRLDATIANLLKNFDTEIAATNSQAIDIKRLFGSFTMDTILQVAFGVQADSLLDEQNPTIQNAKKVFAQNFSIRQLISLAVAIKFPRLKKAFNIRGFPPGVIEYFEQFSQEIIRRKREELRRDGAAASGKASSFLELLLEAEEEFKREEEQKSETEKKSAKFLNNDEMLSQCILFFIAGYDTTATALSLSAYNLALNPEHQEKLHQEIETIIADLAEKRSSSPPSPSSEPIFVDNNSVLDLVTLESLPRFEYLNGVINETLRIYPPAPFLERRAAKDITLESESGEHRLAVRANDVIQIPVYSMHRDPKQFPDPERFDPTRFVPEAGENSLKFHRYAFIPFGSGPRNCVAKSLAMIEAKLALIHVVRRFRFVRCEQTTVPVEFYNSSGILTPKSVILRMEKR